MYGLGSRVRSSLGLVFGDQDLAFRLDILDSWVFRVWGGGLFSGHLAVQGNDRRIKYGFIWPMYQPGKSPNVATIDLQGIRGLRV